MASINNSYEYYQSNQGLLNMLNSKKSGNALIDQIISNNDLKFQKTMEKMGIGSSSSDGKFYSLSKSSNNLLNSIDALKNKSLYEGEDGKEYDKSDLIKKISNFVTAYNSEVTSIDNCGGALKNTFSNELTSTYNVNKDLLDQVGITIDSSGKMSIDNDKIEQTETSKLQEIFGTDSTYMKALAASADSIYGIVDKALSYATTNYTSAGTMLGL